MKISKVLIKAQSLISNPENWCQFILQNKKGQMCAMGAINKAITGDAFNWPDGWMDSPVYNAIEEAADSVHENLDAIELNNDKSHEDVMDMFDIAISCALYDEAGK